MYKNVTPVLLGADLGCYSLARAFYEAAGIRSTVFGKKTLGATQNSRILTFFEEKELSNTAVLRDRLLRYAAQTPEKQRILFPCTDEYAAALMEEREALETDYILPLPPKSASPLFDKSAFYEMAERAGVPTPETVSHSAPPSYRACRELCERLGKPFIIKPSESIAYWRHPFPHMEKVYLAHNASEAECIFASIFASGYTGRVLGQRYIAGGDAAGYVLTFYFDREGRPVMRAAARALLEEHTPKGKGNYAALITAAIPEIAEPLAAMLCAIGYRGFVNFDLRRDIRDGRFYALEMNLRLGRSNYFLTAVGANPGALLLRDYVSKESITPYDATASVLFRTVPYRTVRRYTKEEGLADLAAALHHSGRDVCPWYARVDMKNPRRLAYLLAHMGREQKKFATYLVPAREK